MLMLVEWLLHFDIRVEEGFWIRGCEGGGVGVEEDHEPNK